MSTQGSEAAEGTAATARRPRATWVRVVSGVVVALLVVVGAIFAVRADGQPVHDVALTDGRIWVSGGRSGYWARVNSGAHTFDLVVEGANPASGTKGEVPADILQDGRNAVGITTDRRLVAIDSRTGEPLEGEVQVPRPSYETGVDFQEPDLVAMHGNTLAVVDHDTGRIWAKRLDPKGGTPIGDLLDTGELTTVGANAAITVDLDGDVMAVSAETGKVVEIPAEGEGFGSPEVTELDIAGGRAADITAVGDHWVVLDLEKGEVHAEDLDGPQPLPDETQETAGVTLAMATLQQPGPDAEVVAFSTREEAGFVRISQDGDRDRGQKGVLSGVEDDDKLARYQRISRPVINGDCLYAAWGDGDLVRWGAACGEGQRPAAEMSVSGTFSRRHGVAVRHNRGQVLLNDLDTGRVYDLTLSGDLRIDTWPAEPARGPAAVWDPQEATSTSSPTTSRSTKTDEKTDKKSSKKTSKKSSTKSSTTSTKKSTKKKSG